jgi:hypothetical protein
MTTSFGLTLIFGWGDYVFVEGDIAVPSFVPTVTSRIDNGKGVS